MLRLNPTSGHDNPISHKCVIPSLVLYCRLPTYIYHANVCKDSLSIHDLHSHTTSITEIHQKDVLLDNPSHNIASSTNTENNWLISNSFLRCRLKCSANPSPRFPPAPLRLPSPPELSQPPYEPWGPVTRARPRRQVARGMLPSHELAPKYLKIHTRLLY